MTILLLAMTARRLMNQYLERQETLDCRRETNAASRPFGTPLMPLNSPFQTIAVPHIPSPRPHLIAAAISGLHRDRTLTEFSHKQSLCAF